MGCGGSTIRPESPTDAPAEASGQSGAPGLETPAVDDLRTSALNELKTSAYASAMAKRSEVDYNRAQTYVHTRPTKRPVAEAGRSPGQPEA
jgi:hypothetical protein